tara:strand:- start:1101 stop:1313 length:213 start_codon:yes stop_codon:yes gene_type:complete
MEDYITFEHYLEQKKISLTKFKEAEPNKYEELSKDFEQMNHKSFTNQYLFLINPMRRKYFIEQDSSIIQK